MVSRWSRLKVDAWLVQFIDRISNAFCDGVVGCAIWTFRIEPATTRSPEEPREEARLRGWLALDAFNGKRTMLDGVRHAIDERLIGVVACLWLLGERWKSTGSVGILSLRSLSFENSVGDRVDGLVHANLGRQKLRLC